MVLALEFRKRTCFHAALPSPSVPLKQYQAKNPLYSLELHPPQLYSVPSQPVPPSSSRSSSHPLARPLCTTSKSTPPYLLKPAPLPYSSPTPAPHPLQRSALLGGHHQRSSSSLLRSTETCGEAAPSSALMSSSLLPHYCFSPVELPSLRHRVLR